MVRLHAEARRSARPFLLLSLLLHVTVLPAISVPKRAVADPLDERPRMAIEMVTLADSGPGAAVKAALESGGIETDTASAARLSDSAIIRLAGLDAFLAAASGRATPAWVDAVADAAILGQLPDADAALLAHLRSGPLDAATLSRLLGFDAGDIGRLSMAVDGEIPASEMLRVLDLAPDERRLLRSAWRAPQRMRDLRGALAVASTGTPDAGAGEADDPLVEAPEAEEEEEDQVVVAPVDLWIRYVYTEEQDSTPIDDPEGVRHISAWDVNATDLERVRVINKESGEWRPMIDGDGEAANSPDAPQMASAADPAKGAVPDPNPNRLPESHDAGSSGRDGRDDGRGSPTLGGDRRPGGAAAMGGGGSSPPSAALIAVAEGADRPTMSGTAGFKAATNAESPPDVPSWWRPTAARVRLVQPAPTRAAIVSPAAPTARSGLAPVDRPGDERDRGGTEAETEAEELSTPTPGTADDEGRLGDESPGIVDPVRDVRQSLGWGEFDRDMLQPRPATYGMMGDNNARQSSPQAVLSEEIPLTDDIALTAQGTALGIYIQEIYEIVRDRWFTMDLDPHDKALGIQGQVTLQFVIHRNGKVSDLVLVSSSGHDALDQLAVEAVPLKLPRFNRGLRERAVRHQLVLRYRNPLVNSNRNPR